MLLAERLDAQVYVPPPDEGDPNPVPGQVFRAGDSLAVGVEAFPGMEIAGEANDFVLWVASRRSLVAGDTFIDRGNGLEFPGDWAKKDVPAERIAQSLRPRSSFRSSSCSRRTACPSTAPPSSARSPSRDLVQLGAAAAERRRHDRDHDRRPERGGRPGDAGDVVRPADRAVEREPPRSGRRERNGDREQHELELPAAQESLWQDDGDDRVQHHRCDQQGCERRQQAASEQEAADELCKTRDTAINTGLR